MRVLIRVLSILIGVELVGAAILCGWRLNSTQPSPPPVEVYTDAITGAELLSLPDRYLFDGPEKWRTLGEAYLRFGFLHQAAACLSRAAEADPHSAETAVVYGDCLDRLGRFDAAQAEFQRAAREASGVVQQTAWYFLGRTFLKREQAGEAERAFQSAGSAHLPSVYQRAKLLVRHGRHTEAAPLLRQLVEQAPDELRVWQLQMSVAETAGVPDPSAADAAEHARPMLWLHHLPPELNTLNEDLGMARLFSQALELQKAGNTRTAAQQMLVLTRGETRWQYSNPWLPQTVAAVHLQAGDLATARRLLDDQITQEGFPTALAWNLLAQVEFLEQNFEAAGRCWRRSEFMCPATTDFERRSMMADQAGNANAARHDQGLTRQYAGIAAFRNKAPDQARLDLRNATALVPDLSSAWFYLGESERLLGNTDAAVEAYRQCVTRQPDHGRARRRLDQLQVGSH